MLSKLFNAVGAAFQALALLSAAPIAVASGIAAADHAHPISGSTTAGEKRELPSWLLGVWSREWIAKQDVRPNTFDVHYLQAPTFFADVRFPTDQPRLVRAGSFADLTDAELLLLARQRGFTGRTTVTGTTATWHHEIDFQPPDGTEDVGRLEPIAGIGMVEHALDESYVESWRRVSVDEGRFLVIRIERAGRLDRVLLVISDDFLYVRNHSKRLSSRRARPVLRSSSIWIVNSRRAKYAAAQCRGRFSARRYRGGKAIIWSGLIESRCPMALLLWTYMPKRRTTGMSL
jgi:hypothetical protein